VDRFAINWRTARLDEPTRELLEYTERLTARPGAVGAASCVQVVAYFNYINRIAEGLGAPVEDWLADDGTPRSV